MIELTIQLDDLTLPIDRVRLHTVVERTLTACQVNAAELTLVITSDGAIQALNRTYRGLDAPTDVLSFAAEAADQDFVLPPGSPAYLGDIVISAPTAIRQANAAGHTPFEEILLLTVHGLLHLLGMDHGTTAEKAAMWQKQHEILQLNNLAHVTPTE